MNYRVQSVFGADMVRAIASRIDLIAEAWHREAAGRACRMTVGFDPAEAVEHTAGWSYGGGADRLFVDVELPADATYLEVRALVRPAVLAIVNSLPFNHQTGGYRPGAS